MSLGKSTKQRGEELTDSVANVIKLIIGKRPIANVLYKLIKCYCIIPAALIAY